MQVSNLFRWAERLTFSPDLLLLEWLKARLLDSLRLWEGSTSFLLLFYSFYLFSCKMMSLIFLVIGSCFIVLGCLECLVGCFWVFCWM